MKTKLEKLKSVNFLLLSIFIFTVSSSLIGLPGWAAPWPGFGPTTHNPSYEKSIEANLNFLPPPAEEIKSFSPYIDPDLSETQGVESPLKDPRFKDYDVIVVVNSHSQEPDRRGYPQRLFVYKRGEGLMYYWKISTGMKGFETAKGYFNPKTFSPRHWSSIYDAPMFWSVFFKGGMALHTSIDTENLADLGEKAVSHGCVHIEDHRAEVVYHLIGNSGYGSVDNLDEKTGKPTGNKISSYKSLIIVR